MYGDVSKAIDFGTGIVAGEAPDETAWQEDGLPASVVGMLIKLACLDQPFWLLWKHAGLANVARYKIQGQ